MELLLVSLTLVGLLILFLGGSVWIGIALFIVGFGGFTFFLDIPSGIVMANVVWNSTSGSVPT